MVSSMDHQHTCFYPYVCFSLQLSWKLHKRRNSIWLKCILAYSRIGLYCLNWTWNTKSKCSKASNNISRKMPWRRAWQPAPLLLPGEVHGQKSLMGYSMMSHGVKHDRSDLACTMTYGFYKSETFSLFKKKMPRNTSKYKKKSCKSPWQDPVSTDPMMETENITVQILWNHFIRIQWD